MRGYDVAQARRHYTLRAHDCTACATGNARLRARRVHHRRQEKSYAPFVDRPAATAAVDFASHAGSADGIIRLVERLIDIEPPETTAIGPLRIMVGDLYVETMTRHRRNRTARACVGATIGTMLCAMQPRICARGARPRFSRETQHGLRDLIEFPLTVHCCKDAQAAAHVATRGYRVRSSGSASWAGARGGVGVSSGGADVVAVLG